MSGKRPSFLSALLILILVGGLLVWWVNALTNEDPLWFLRSFDAQADWITVYWDGNVTMCFPGDPEYSAIMETFADAVERWTGYEDSVGLSEENLERYRVKERFLELHYNRPVRVHTRYLFPEAKVYYIPMSGVHATYRRVFAGLTDVPRAGVLNVSEERFAALQDAVEQVTVLDKSQN